MLTKNIVFNIMLITNEKKFVYFPENVINNLIKRKENDYEQSNITRIKKI